MSIKPLSVSDLRVAPVAPVARAAPAATAQATAAASAPALAGLARSMAASAPVDSDRVSKIKAAIQQGTYPILPETVADRLIALKLEWNPDDQA